MDEVSTVLNDNLPDLLSVFPSDIVIFLCAVVGLIIVLAIWRIVTGG